jgi:Na+/pantothenate symporter
MRFGIADWAVIAAVPAIAWILGRKGRQRGSWRGYFLAKGNLNTTGVAATYFGANLTFTAIFLILSEEGYRRGIWAFSVPFMWLCGTLFFLKVYPRLKPYIQDGKTLHQVLGEAFESSGLQRWVAVWTIVAFVGTVALEFYGGIILLRWTNLPLFTSLTVALLLALLVSSFTVAGGFRGIALADIWLDIVALAATVILAYCVFRHYRGFIFSGLPTNADFSNSQIPLVTGVGDNILFVIGMVIILLPFQLCTLDSWQRLVAWKKRERSPTSLLLIGAVILSLAYCVPILIGLVLRNQGLSIVDGSHPLKLFLDNSGIMPAVLGLVFAGFISAMFSTADELLNCCSLSLLFDAFLIPRNNSQRTKHDEAKLVLSGQFYTGVFAFVSAGIAFIAYAYGRKASELALAIFSTQVVFTLPIMIALYDRHKAPRLTVPAKTGMVIAFGLALGSVFMGWIWHSKTTVDAAPVLAGVASFLVIGVAWKLTK